MLKNQVLKIFSWKIFGGSEKGFTFASSNNKNNSNNKKFKHYGKRKFLP